MKNILLLIVSVLFSLTVDAQALVIAHRGASYSAPENTVSSAKLAWTQNADAVELDIYQTTDNRVMVMHDSNTKRTTGQSYKIAETSSDVLRKLDAGSWKDAKYAGEKIPFLEEMIATVPAGKILVVEIKCGKTVLPALKEIVDKCGKKDQLVFIAFDWETILEAKQLFPANRCYWLSSSSADVYEKMAEASQKGLDGLDLVGKIIDRKLVKKARHYKLEVLSWTIDDPAEAKRLVKIGVKAITTNRPDLMGQTIR
jgi:glycerophosphoryl diester phosphodiesterase